MDEFELKPLSLRGVPRAIEKVKQYRLLNEPGNAESICRDILLADPDNHDGRILLLLSLTDQFARGLGGRYEEAHAIAAALADEYERAYYTGIVFERRGKAHHRSGVPGCGQIAYEWLRAAMEMFDRAAALRAEGDDESILRWNACVRRLREHADIRPSDETHRVPPLTNE